MLFGLGVGATVLAAVGLGYLVGSGKESKSQSGADSDELPPAIGGMPPLKRQKSALEEELSGQIQRKDYKIQQMMKEVQELKKHVELNLHANLTQESTQEYLTPEARQRLLQQFKMYDREGTGFISAKNVKDLHHNLGEQITDEEAQEAVEEMTGGTTDKLDSTTFIKWWFNKYKTGKSGSAYSERFKLMSAKIEHADEKFHDIGSIKTQEVSKEEKLKYRMFFSYKTKGGKLVQISPWHDIPLYNQGQGLHARIFNFVCEIPRWTRAKYEIATGERYNPIKQDVKNGLPRFYKYGDMMFNYGLLPQTWEDPDHTPETTGFKGDNDPIDVVEIGFKQLKTGSVTAVKILGVLGLIDSGETDWKLIAINIADPMAEKLEDIEDVNEHIPGALDAIKKYFRIYKATPKGEKINEFALQERYMDREFAHQVIDDCHKFWQTLRANKKEVV